ncbi:hypothetical protein AX15_001374 [Amanita polypyramis BW_CC]|nr:hypothetical protein AX15_001374 [Amanita polypyramis BW_CC]
MVLIHKLRQVEGIDIRQLREQQNDHKLVAGQGEPKAQDRSRTVEETQNSQTESKTTPVCTISPPHRPLTRSQTGHVPKRKSRDDSPVWADKATSATPRKRPKSTSPRKQLAEDSERTDDELTPEHANAPSVLSVGSDSAAQSQVLVDDDSSAQLTFLNSNPDGPVAPNVVRRTSRSRVVLPTPVPNLTKKSRGRRVPTTASPDPSGNLTDGRLYVCKVEGCGKCFFRGEHLKRHIRSIHTHEKPFKCTYPECEKLFNRHDNLLQHLKVHKDPSKPGKRPQQSPSDSPNDTDQEDQVDDIATSGGIASAPVTPSQPLRFPDLYKSTNSVIRSTAPSPLPTTIISYTSIASYTTLATPVLSTEPLGFSTNMAVSSVRTEIPSSPRLQNSSKTTTG